MTQEIFKFYTQGRMAFKEAKLKGVKKYYVEGYASTSDKDLAGEVISESAQESMLRQFRNRNVTIDIEHEEWYDDNGKQLDKPKSSMIPVAKIIEAKKTAKGTWVKAELNTNIERFKEVWGSIKDGFLNAFSIAFFPIKQIGNVIDDLNIVNVTMTGTPVNPKATFAPVMKSAVAYLKSIEKESAPKMENETQIETPVEQPAEKAVEQKPVEEVVEEQPKEESNELKSEEDIKKEEAETEEVKEEVKNNIQTVQEEVKKEVTESKKDSEEDISKLIDKILEQKLKEFEAKLNPEKEEVKTDEPKQEANAEQPKVVPQEVPSKPVSPLSMIKAFQRRQNELDLNPKLKALVENTPEVETNKQIVKTKSPLQLI